MTNVFFVVPFLLFKAYQFETQPPDWMKLDSNVILVAIYIYALVVCGFMARQVFLVARWMFPAVEFVSGKRLSPVYFRLLFGGVILGLATWALQSIIAAIF